MSRGHGDKAMSRWEVKQDHPNPWRQVKNEMRCPHPDTNADKCHVQEWHTANATTVLVPFPHHFWWVPQLFLLTSLTGIAYAYRASFRRNPMSSGFNEPDRRTTRHLFTFREFEKTAEKETHGVSFFIKLCLSSPKKYKTMLERTAWPLRSRSNFHG